MHDLDRDGAVERLVAGQVDGRHPAAAELGLEPVAAREDRADHLCAGRAGVHGMQASQAVSPARRAIRPPGRRRRAPPRPPAAAPSRASRRRTAAAGRTRSPSWTPARRSSPASRPTSRSAMSIPDETPAAVTTLPSSTTRSASRLGAELAQPLEEEPVAGGARALQQPGGAEHQRAGADRGRPAGRLRRRGAASRAPLVAQQRPVALAAGDEDDVGIGRLVDRGLGDQRQSHRCRPARARLGARRTRTSQPGTRAQHLVGADRVEQGQSSRR